MIPCNSSNLMTFTNVSLFKPYRHVLIFTRLASTNSIKGGKRQRRRSKPPSTSSNSPRSKALVQQNTHNSTRRNSPSTVAPLSTVLASPKLQKKIYGKFLNFQNTAKDVFKSHFESDGPFFTMKMERRRLEMDGNWWAWNLFLACTPALILCLVCRYYKDEMEEFYERQRLIERRQEGLEDDDEMDVPSSSSSSLENDGNRNIWDDLKQKQSLWDAFMYLFNNVLQGKEEEDQSSVSDPTHVETQVHAHEETTTQLEHEEEPSIHALLERIAALEAKLDAQSDMIQKKKPSTPSSHPSSSIRDRNEARLRELRDIEDMRRVEETRTTLLETLKLASWNNLKSKGEAIMKAGQDLLEDIERVFHMEEVGSKRNKSDVLHEENRDENALDLKSSCNTDQDSPNNDESLENKSDQIIMPNLLEEQKNTSS
eukprot:CAMPEP_0176480154 /NCGR_PEP_ID=MMETSP0200_2-20121128/2125_1 /TAXON_ID=947934 /ORGANISM="Chaetoceros sp., Strain GSL56" /LENGTH=426 /DNA_ID=CAMNT_0017876253 /DNA_START=1 /DNA_END=1278 /DNA_ORIENTATION=-